LGIDKVQNKIAHQISYGSRQFESAINKNIRELGSLVDRIQAIIDKKRPPIDAENEKSITPVLDSFLPKVLFRIIGQYMD
jgi:hypothetical protein